MGFSIFKTVAIPLRGYSELKQAPTYIPPYDIRGPNYRIGPESQSNTLNHKE
jgi:hypothetical protein